MSYTPQSRPSVTVRWIAVLCLVLASIAATAQVVHFHADQLAGTAKHCPLCVVLHATPAVVQSAPINFSFQAAAYLPAWENPGHNSAAASFALFSRPPPLA